MDLPTIVLLFSGKRKSGKDFTVELLKEKFGDAQCEIIRISEPIKTFWASKLGLNLEELMGDGAYKEQYRIDMIKWSDEVRKENFGYFCEAACKKAQLKPIWIVSDIRRKTDLVWFRKNYSTKIKTVKVTASEETRQKRGWVFKTGVDDSESECNLDDIGNWDFIISNDSSEEEFNKCLNSLILCINQTILQ